MRIACPNCAAEYEVPESLLATGPRLLRCARCSHQFQAALPEPEPDLPVFERPAVPLAERLAGLGPAEPPEPEPPEPPPPEPEPEPAPPEPEPPPPEPPVLPVEPPAPAPAPPPREEPAVRAEPERPPPTRGLSQHSPMDPPLRQRLVEQEQGPEPGGGVALAGWLLSLAVLLAALWAAWQFRAAIIQAWPPAERLYALLGLA